MEVRRNRQLKQFKHCEICQMWQLNSYNRISWAMSWWGLAFRSVDLAESVSWAQLLWTARTNTTQVILQIFYEDTMCHSHESCSMAHKEEEKRPISLWQNYPVNLTLCQFKFSEKESNCHVVKVMCVHWRLLPTEQLTFNLARLLTRKEWNVSRQLYKTLNTIRPIRSNFSK